MAFTENNLIIARMVKGGGVTMVVVTLDSQTEDSPHNFWLSPCSIYK